MYCWNSLNFLVSVVRLSLEYRRLEVQSPNMSTGYHSVAKNCTDLPSHTIVGHDSDLNNVLWDIYKSSKNFLYNRPLINEYYKITNFVFRHFYIHLTTSSRLPVQSDTIHWWSCWLPCQHMLWVQTRSGSEAWWEDGTLQSDRNHWGDTLLQVSPCALTGP